MKLVSLIRIYSEGRHNAFTGLTCFGGRYLLGFRNADTHSAKGGRHVLLSSADACQWTFLQETSFPSPPDLPPGTEMDLRDVSFLNLGKELRLYSFVLSPLVNDDYLRPPCSTVQITQDGINWSPPQEILREVILWKPIFWKGEFWCAGYRRIAGEGLVVELYRSADGLAWERGSRIGAGNETCLASRGKDVLQAYMRVQDPPYYLQIWESDFPFERWRHVSSIPKVIQAPHLVDVGKHRFLLGREAGQRPYLSRSKVWEVNGESADELLELPSLGDTSYFGTAMAPNGDLLVSYYSQHERESGEPLETRGGNDKPADIFVARLKP